MSGLPTPPRDAATQYVVLPCYEKDGGHADQIVAPPSRVLTVEVIGPIAFLRISNYPYDAERKDNIPTLIEDCDVDAKALLQAIAVQLGYEVVRPVIPAVWP